LLTPSAQDCSNFGGSERWKITDFFSHKKLSVKVVGLRAGGLGDLDDYIAAFRTKKRYLFRTAFG